MSTIASILNPSTAGSTSASGAAASTTAAQTGEEFNSFIKLLTAQIRNQDPLAPLDSTQFVEQLATFSTLEQQVGSNTRLDSIAGIMNDLHTVIANDWLGQSVTVESSWVPYSGDPITYEFDRSEDVDRAVLTIRDSDGNPSWSEGLNLNDQTFSWDGRTSNGGQVTPDTLHQFSIDLFDGDTYIGSVAPQIHTTVTEFATEDGKVVLGTALNVQTELDSVRKVDDAN
ncbi:MAG: flagellar hook assembly protein FlgD [Hyphomonas sp.]